MRSTMKMLAARSRSDGGDARSYRQEMGEPVYYPHSRMEGAQNARNEMEMYGYGESGAAGAYNRNEMNAPMNWEYTRTDTASGDMEARRNYRRYKNGRFAPRSEMDYSGGEAHRPFGPPPPVYEEGGNMNLIGFSAGGEFRQDYPNNATYAHTPKHSEQMHGGAKYDHAKHMDRAMAEEWMSMLENEDGTKGPHWTFEQAKTMMQQHNLSFDPAEFWAVLNAIYSDDVAVAKKHGVNNPEYFIDRAKSWLNDKDAVDGKAAAYFCYIVK